MKLGPQTFVMVGKLDMARDLLDKRNAIYSSRPRAPMVSECVSKGYRTLFLPYGDKWRSYHRLHASVLNMRMSQTYRPIHDIESRQMLLELTKPDAGERFPFYFFRYSASLIFSLAYGIRLPKGTEPEAQAVEHIMHELNWVFLHNWLVDMMPWLNVLPKVLAPWKRIADKMHDFEKAFLSKVIAEGEGKPGWNWTKSVLASKDGKRMSRTEVGYIIGNLYEAGSDSSAVSMAVLVMAAILYPKMASKAQEELDRVVGPDRMPTFDDLDNLPFIHAIVKELLRWRPVTPGGVPHAVIEDDEYMGYRIPKGTVILPNYWALAMDPDTFEDPEQFIPERWIENPDVPVFSFGFGRRVCTGRHIAMNSLLITTARLLWAFNIGHAYEVKDGVKVQCPVDPNAYTSTFNSSPEPFKASFVPRSAKVLEVMNHEWASAEKDHLVHLEHLQIKLENAAKEEKAAEEEKATS
ncbi:putative cytochrome P450 [Lasiosphaeria miniovina]|uniref:Cytochrome P450 n=1 Tax=Lasiosphaeria miniovina TaxID=1954250 RepID=A0AA40AMB3_9PEZI|nr:putative cytochrome P450 [Lasiosphaeria miniovina]KAK0718480.1 putative cytochrome P450 [Lasiosphaeria miniovina]